MRKPPDLLYGADDPPPHLVTILCGLQHAGLVSLNLVVPVLVAEAAGASAATAAAMVSLTLLAIAAGTLLQCRAGRRIGSGYLCYPVPTVIYLVPALAIANAGGLPLVFGMTLAAGLFEVLLARGLVRLRVFFPPEIAGLVVLLTGVATGVVGIRSILASAGANGLVPIDDLLGAVVALATMVVLNVWTRGLARMLCVLLGIVAGYGVSIAAGFANAPELSRVSAESLFALPAIDHVGWSFEAQLALPFAVAAIAAMLKTVGCVASAQRATDADWKRADMRNLSAGVAADGWSTVVASAIGGVGLNAATSAVGLATATGVHSRRIGYAVAAFAVVLAFMPKVGLLFSMMPRPVAGAALVFSSVFIIVNGIETMTARMIDMRRALVIGLGLCTGLAVDMLPAIVGSLPEAARSALSTSLVVGTLVGLLLNLAFRIGVRARSTIDLPLARPDTGALERHVRDLGARWGARRDVIERAAFVLPQAIETIVASGAATGPLTVSATFDEFSLDLRIDYPGLPPDLPERRPTTEAILAGPDGESRLAGFMLRRQADAVRATQRDGRTSVHVHFEH